MRPSLLLHVCCAPCATAVIRRLAEDHRLTLLFENPNIQPREEYELRLREMKRYAADLELPLLPVSSEPERWEQAVVGLEHEPEGGRRCDVCFRVRLAETADRAAAGGFDLVATTLTISPHKPADRINRILAEEAERAGVRALEADFKKRDGFRESCRLSREAGLYRQRYCGCLPSLHPPLTPGPSPPEGARGDQVASSQDVTPSPAPRERGPGGEVGPVRSSTVG